MGSCCSFPSHEPSVVELLPEQSIEKDYHGSIDEYLKALEAEAEQLMSSKSTGWVNEPVEKDGLEVSSHKVRNNKMIIARSKAEYELDAMSLFELLRSPTGFKIIDPDTKNHEDEPAKTLAGYDPSWNKVILTYARTELQWPFGARYFTSFCAGNKSKMLFLGKSILDPDIVPDKGRIKCLTTYAYKVIPLTDKRCRLEQICYLDMGGSIPSCLINTVVRKGYFQGLHKRLLAHLAENKAAFVDPDHVQLTTQ